jgi:hypothetical protein
LLEGVIARGWLTHPDFPLTEIVVCPLRVQESRFYDVEVLVAGDLAPVLRKSYSDPGTLQQPDYLVALFAHWAIMLAIAILLLSSIIM